MRTLALPLVAAALLAGCGVENQPDAVPASTSLLVTVDPDGAHGSQPARTVHLRCPGSACAITKRLTARDFAPTRPGVMCTMIYGGPETAKVFGLLRGRPINARFSRTDGCQTNRWERVKTLLGAAR